MRRGLRRLKESAAGEAISRRLFPVATGSASRVRRQAIIFHFLKYRGQYGIEDTRRALQEAHARGVRSYCITIDRHGADYLPRLYGPARYTVLDDAKKLPLKVAEIYRRLTS